MTNFLKLEKTYELKVYQKETAERVGVELPMEYLERALVFTLFTEDTYEMCGGFTMAYDGPLRCLEQIPQSVIPVHSLMDRYKDACFEINGLWLDRKSAPEGARLALYLKAIEEAVKLGVRGKHKYVYAYDADNSKLRKFYRNFNSKKIYEGPVASLPGMNKTGLEVVEMGCMKKLPLTVLRNPGFLISRAVKPKQLKWAASALKFA